MASSLEDFVVKVDYQTGRPIWIFGDPTKYWLTWQTIRSDICSSPYETPTGSTLINYAAAQARTRMRVVCLDASRQVAFDFEYVSKTPCISSWNAVKLRLNGLRIE